MTALPILFPTISSAPVERLSVRQVARMGEIYLNAREAEREAAERAKQSWSEQDISAHSVRADIMKATKQALDDVLAVMHTGDGPNVTRVYSDVTAGGHRVIVRAVGGVVSVWVMMR